MICGLGNPGDSYRWTRHNIGYMVVDKFIEDKEGIGGVGERYQYFEIMRDTQSLVVLKPSTFMNLSGIPIFDARDSFDVTLDNLLVVLDDVNLPFGFLRLREKGSDGGHKGLASVIYHLSSEEFPRLRIGVGRSDEEIPLSEYVLLDFSKKEREHLPEVIESAVHSIELWCDEGVEQAMNITNRKIS
jgi:PTH1 family peptidyl-tRNA hydrolase